MTQPDPMGPLSTVNHFGITADEGKVVVQLLGPYFRRGFEPDEAL